ncbi:hypothetical protein P8452_44189 [Trifolium repens]|nr:hypothetical protein P8452_44189 [Trifolium repens]
MDIKTTKNDIVPQKIACVPWKVCNKKRVYIGSVILLLVILLAIVSTILVLKFHHSSSKDDDHKDPKDDPTVWVFPTPTSPKNELKPYIIYTGGEGEFKDEATALSLYHHLLQEVIPRNSPSRPILRYYWNWKTFSGFVANLTDEEASKMAGLKGVVSVSPEVIYYPDSTSKKWKHQRRKKKWADPTHTAQLTLIKPPPPPKPPPDGGTRTMAIVLPKDGSAREYGAASCLQCRILENWGLDGNSPDIFCVTKGFKTEVWKSKVADPSTTVRRKRVACRWVRPLLPPKSSNAGLPPEKNGSQVSSMHLLPQRTPSKPPDLGSSVGVRKIFFEQDKMESNHYTGCRE